MNIFTVAQLMNHNAGSPYYDTKSNKVKCSLSPTLTMLGRDEYDLEVCNLGSNKQKEQINKKNKISLADSLHNKTSTTDTNLHKKRTRKVNPISDEDRCCAITTDGSRCSLKKYKNSEDMCYIHYAKTLPVIEKPAPEVMNEPKKWFSMKWW